MPADNGYYLIRKRAVPLVLQKVVEVDRLLASGKAHTVNEAAAAAGISRSTYYKYESDVEEFHDSSKGTTLTLLCEIDDKIGLLSDMLKIIADNRANILTIHQSIPLNGVASLSISIQILENTGNINNMISSLEQMEGVSKARIAGRE
ncbi:MAG: ACT domain-containing protein [Lachnospiraceae bacterium]|jgi:chorismate mutase|nr:ACT domain-containing protein [Lachnospiraceae bacterium]